MKTSIVASKLGAEFIAQTLANYAEHTALLNKIVADLGAMPEMARDSFLKCFKGNAYISFSSLSRDNAAIIELNDKTWLLISKQLKSLGATNAASELVEITYKKDFLKETLSEERIYEVLAQLDHIDSLQSTVKEVKEQLSALNGENVDFTDKLKIKKGSTEERLSVLGKLVEIACLAWNDCMKDRVHMSKYSLEQIEKAVAQTLEAVKAGDKFRFENSFEAKGFANGNIDIKFFTTVADRIDNLAA